MVWPTQREVKDCTNVMECVDSLIRRAELYSLLVERVLKIGTED